MTSLAEAYYRRLYAFHEPTVEEFYSPSEPRDREGKWTRGGSSGKVWSGVSAHPDHRVAPKSKIRSMPKDDLGRAKLATGIFDADLGDGYTARVNKVGSIHGGIYVHVILRKGNVEVGQSTRHLTLENGQLVVNHESLYINPAHQNKGIADRFNAHAVAEYQRLGVDHIDLTAGSTVGGYAWARQGFRVREEERKEFLLKQLDRIDTVTKKPVLREHAKAIKADAAALRKAIEAGEDVQPIHLASLGEKYARHNGYDDHKNTYTTWPGKSLLIGTTWPGQYFFDANKALSAAATDLEHADLRPAFRLEEFYSPSEPRDREGKWTTGLRTGKGFGGLSAPRDHRVKPTPRFHNPPTSKELDALAVAEGSLKDRRKAFYKSIYETDLPDGHRSVITQYHDTGTGTVEIAGEIQTRSGAVRGHFERKLEDDGDWYDASAVEPSPYGPGYQNLKVNTGVSVEHTSFAVDDSRLAGGIGSAFIQHSVDQYKKLGVDHVTIYAGDEVGGYAWAREGFRIEDGVRNKNPYVSAVGTWRSRDQEIQAISVSAERILREKVQSGVVPAKHLDEALHTIDALRAASAAGEDVQPIHFASIGEQNARFKADTKQGQPYDSWPGKEMMLGTGYQAAYYFNANRAVTAAIEFACHDASCAPPPAGVGGSTPALQARRSVVPGYGPTQRRDVHLGAVRVTYKPDYPDDHPDPGEVVWAKVRYQEDVNQSKDRPVLIIGRINGTDKLAAVQLTSNDRPGKDRLPIGTGSWDRLGRQSAVKLDQIIVIDPKDYRREGSKFEKDKFEGVIGRLAAYHRTPVQIAASAKLLEHFHTSGGIEFACHDASCRPPTAGGTGGSRPAGGGVKGTTEFGRRINAMLDADRNIQDMSKATIDASHQRRIDSERGFAAQRLQDRYTTGRLSDKVTMTEKYWMRDERDTPEWEAAQKLAYDMRTAILNINHVRKPGYEPQGEAERILKDAIAKRVGDDLDPYTPLHVTLPFGNLTLAGELRRSYNKTNSVIIDDAMEQSVNKIGHEIRKEVEARHAAIDYSEDRKRYDEGMAKINEIAATMYDGRGGEVSIANYERGGVQAFVFAPKDQGILHAGVRDPTIMKINDLAKEYGILNSNYSTHLAYIQNRDHQRIMQEVLGEITPLGGEFKFLPGNKKNQMGRMTTHDQVAAGVKRYPTTWINETNEGNPMKFRQVKGRAHYKHRRSDGYSEITLDGKIATSIHEFAHRFEATVPGVRQLEERFFDRRTAGEETKPLGKGFDKDEVGKEDKFFNKYAGKQYSGDYFELLSMGYEHASMTKTGWDGIDDDYKAFVLGTLVSAYRG